MPRNYDFTQAEIEQSLEKTRSVSAAARYLKVDYRTIRRLAKLYGLFRHHKNQAGVGLKKPRGMKLDLQAVLDGRNVIKNKYYLKVLLIRGKDLEERCDRCGFDERRMLDRTVPLRLDFIDGDQQNQHRRNLRLLCPNCNFLERSEKRVSQILEEYERHLSR